MSSITACEICKTPLNIWQLDSENELDLCPSCNHVERDMKRCPSGARRHPWGGVGAFDRFRLALTWRSQARALQKRNVDPKDLLEIGFGAGILLERHLTEGRNVQGSEAEMLERPVGDDLLQRIVHHKVCAEDLSLAPESIDLFYGVHVIEHLLDPCKVFATAAKSLRPNGVIHFVTPAGDSLGLKFFGTAWWNLEDPTHIRFFSPDSLKLALSKAGFDRIEIRRPWWDSLGVESASLLRRLGLGNNSEHGALGNSFGRVLLLMMMPLFFVLRTFVPKLRPSLEVVAQKRIV